MAITGPRSAKPWYDREFKLAVVRLIATGQKSPAQTSREHHLDTKVLYRWRKEKEDELLGEEAFQPRWRCLRCVPAPREAQAEVLGERSALQAASTSMPDDEQGHSEDDKHRALLERLCGKLALENVRLQQQLAAQRRRQEPKPGARAKTTRSRTRCASLP